jgi:hypothetical protein
MSPSGDAKAGRTRRCLPVPGGSWRHRLPSRFRVGKRGEGRVVQQRLPIPARLTISHLRSRPTAERALGTFERPGLGAAIARPEGLVNTPDKVANALATLRRCRDSIDASAYRSAICTRIGRLPAPRFAFRQGVPNDLSAERNASSLARIRLGHARKVSYENAILRTRGRVLRQLDKPVRRSTVRYSNESQEVEASLFDGTVADRSRRAAATHG